MNNKILTVKNLSAFYNKKTILEDIYFQIKEHSFTSILGKNGSGKSTLLSIITNTKSSNLIINNNNFILLNNKKLSKYNNIEKAKIMAFLPQNEKNPWNYSVKEIIEMGRYPYRKFGSELSKIDKEIINKNIELLNLEKICNNSIFEISGGELQRTYLARALCQEPKLLILDEPFSQLDISHQHELCNFLREKVAQKKITIIITLHDLNLAPLYCTDSIFINKGKIIAEGNTEDVFTEEVLKKTFEKNFKIFNHPIYNTKQCAILK